MHRLLIRKHLLKTLIWLLLILISIGLINSFKKIAHAIEPLEVTLVQQGAADGTGNAVILKTNNCASGQVAFTRKFEDTTEEPIGTRTDRDSDGGASLFYTLPWAGRNFPNMTYRFWAYCGPFELGNKVGEASVGLDDQGIPTGIHTPPGPPFSVAPPSLTLGSLNHVFSTNPLKAKFSNLGAVVTGLLGIFFTIAGFLLLIWLTWGVLQYIFAGGDKTKLAQARARITWAIVGFGIVAISFAVSQYAQRIFPQRLPNTGNERGVTEITAPSAVPSP